MPIRFIGAGFDHGSGIPGCARAPAVLRGLRPDRDLAERGVAAGWSRTLLEDEPVGAMPTVDGYLERLARQVASAVRGRRFVVVVGGDHTVAVGTWTGVRRALRAPFGLVWIDAHMDCHTPATSPSGNLHGMPLAALLGEPVAPLQAVTGGRAVVDGRRLCLVGVRSHEPEEVRLARRHGVACLAMTTVRRLGLARALRRAVARVTASGGGFGISLDLDALDPRDAPAVGTPAPDGLHPAELIEALHGLHRHPGYLGFELAEYNPTLDRDGRSARLVRCLLWAAVPRGDEPWNA